MPDVHSILAGLLALLLPQSRGGNGDHVPLTVEGKGSNVCRVAMKLAQTFLVERIPNVDKPIRASSSKRIVVHVECNSIDWVYVLCPILLHTVALDRKSVV